MDNAAKNMIGARYGKLIIISRNTKNLNNKAYWNCLCDCGKETVGYTGQLRNGQKASCGCLRKRERTIKDIEKGFIYKERKHKHGHSSNGKTSPTYQSWRAMQQRCECPKNKDYHSYGGKGIKVDIKWKSFINFLEDMGERPSKDYSLDRINPEKDYEPSNCQWITKTENSKKGNAQRKERALGRVEVAC